MACAVFALLCAGMPDARATDEPDSGRGLVVSSGVSLDTIGNGFTHMGGEWTRAKSFTQDGIVVRAKAGVGTFRERISETSVSYYAGEALAGYQAWQGQTRLRALIGPVFKAEQRTHGLQQAGIRGEAEALLLIAGGGFATLAAHVSSIDSEWGARLGAGYPVHGGLKIGPEIGVTGSGGRIEGRAGLGLHGIAFAGLSLSLGAGAALDQDRRTGFYAQTYLERRF